MTDRPKRLRWTPPESAPPAHPYRDSALLYVVLSILIVVVAWVTGGALGRAVGIAVVFFVAATTWSFWRWRQRLSRAADEADGESAEGREKPAA